LTSIFVRTPNQGTFVGDCWPGKSVWIDFLNENAQQFYENQFDYSIFKG